MKFLFYDNDGLAAWVKTYRGLVDSRWFRDLPTRRKLLVPTQEAVLAGRVPAEIRVDGETFEVIREG